MFSRRTEWDLEESDLARALRERTAAQLSVADLTASNPTRCGFEYDPDLLTPLTDRAAFDYDPNPKGSVRAREAVCAYYAASEVGDCVRNRVGLDPENVLLTTSTSEAYGYLFKLLCDPGDEILAPQPSYPLFDFLADAESVRVVAAPLVYDHGWQMELEGLRRNITPTTRAVVLVHPNNPTGHFTKLEESRELAAVCRQHGMALIVDEVFLDYGFAQAGLGEPGLSESHQSRTGLSKLDQGSFLWRDLGVLTFVVSGLSKIAGLPQMKVAWLAATGPGAREAMARLEVLADTYLSVNAPMQRALPVWLKGRTGIQNQIRERTRSNLAALDRRLAAHEDRRGEVLVNRLIVEGGWYAVLRVPAVQADDQTVRELLDDGVWVHPGHFFGFGNSGWMVLSLLTPANEFSTGLEIFFGYFGRNHKSYQMSRFVNSSV